MKQKISLDRLVAVDPLTEWLDANLPALGTGPLKAELIHGGTSNAIVRLQRGRGPVVLRRPPVDPPPASQRAMMREATVLAALNRTAVPHPHFHAACDDPSVIGASFYVMEEVDGWSAELGTNDCRYQPPFDEGEHRRQLGFAMADGLIALSKVDYRAVGLEHFGNPDGFLARQVERWRSQLESYATRYPDYTPRDIPGFEYVTRWLEDNVPPMSPAGLIHGDYGSPNLIFAKEPPARIMAIVDWELATIGDPLLDLGWLLYNLRDANEPDLVPRSAYYDSRGFPTRQEITEYYAAGTKRPVADVDYYMVLAQYKLACIVEYKVALAATGRQSRSVGELFGPMVLNLIAEAEKIARRAG